MATYGAGYNYTTAKRKKQKYTLIERVIDFSLTPVTGGTQNIIKTAWAADDIVNFISIRKGTTVLGVQVDTITQGTVGSGFSIGDGTIAAKFGTIRMSKATTGADSQQEMSGEATALKPEQTGLFNSDSQFDIPTYYSANDTIDLTVIGTPIAGKYKIIVHVLEDGK